MERTSSCLGSIGPFPPEFALTSAFRPYPTGMTYSLGLGKETEEENGVGETTDGEDQVVFPAYRVSPI
jgi:hypothetical protein